MTALAAALYLLGAAQSLAYAEARARRRADAGADRLDAAVAALWPAVLLVGVVWCCWTGATRLLRGRP
jgi:hypothetical protein